MALGYMAPVFPMALLYCFPLSIEEEAEAGELMTGPKV